MNLLFRKKSAYILLSIMNATMLLLFLPTSVHATPVSHPGQIKISVFDELRQPVQNADIGVSCGNSSPVDTGIPTDYSGTEYIDPATLLGASCVSGDPIIIQVASSTLVTQTYPVINAASNYYSDIDPDSALTYHDGSNNVYSFGVETTGQYDASFWNMSDDPLGLSFPTGTPDAVVPNYSGTPLLNFDWSGSSPTGGISGYDWDAEFTKTVTTGEGMYEFDAGVDDGIRVYIDDTPLTPDGWTTQGIGTLYSWKTHLTAGSHTIKVDYFQGGGGSALKTAFYPIFPASPVLSVVKPIISPLDDAFSSPIITINASVAGNITSSGSCSYSGSVNSGNTDIPLSLSPLDGDHSDCTLTLTDPSTDLSNTISVPSFTAASGYQTHYISSCQDLENVGNNPNTYLDQITLTNSIDCTGIDFAPLSFGGNAFQGFFDGGYNTISNLSINQPGIDGVGLFSATNAALMGNVTITGSGVAGRNEVGAFVGYARNTNFVSVSSTMAVSNGTGSGSWGVGGLVGYLNYDDGLNHNLNHLYVSGTVTSTASTIGGIAGEMDVTYAGTNVLVQSVTSTAVIGSADFPSSESGGLFGDVWSINTSDAASTTLTIDHAYASGDVFGGGGGWSNTGGLVGLFESVTNGGPLAISVTSSTAAGNVTSNNGYAGGFIGDNVIYYADHDFQQTFDGDLATGSVVGDAFSRYVGGFLGFVNMNNDAGVHQELLIKNSVASGSTVQGYLYVGGFVGGDDGDSGQVRLNYDYSSGGLIFQNDYSSANVTHAVDSSNNYFGGFAGILNGNASDSIQYPAAIAVDQCAAVGSVTAENSAAVGGFVGEIDGNVAITNSYSTGDTVGAVYTGGFVGVLGAVNPGSLVPDGIAASYSTGAVTSTSDYAGGFAGYLITSEMIGDYAVSHVSTPGDNHGGLMGGISGGIPPAYDVYDQARTGQIELMAGAGVDAPMFGLMAVNGDGTGSNPVPDDAYFFNSTSTEPYDFHDYFPADYWNFDTVWNVHRNTYPTLKNLPYALIQGNGSEQSPYQIRSCEDLQTMSNQDPSSYFQLQNDIDCTGIDFQPNDFGDASFTGSLDGQGYSIINLNVNQSYSDAGLFRFVADATIHDIVFDGGSIQSYNNAGVIAGSALDTNIFNVTSTASVISNDDGSYFGGLVGTATFSNGLANNWSGLTVSSTLGAGAIAGGLAGYLEVLDAGTTFAVNSSTFSGNINYSIDNLYDAGGLIGLTYVHNAEGGATTTLRIANSSASSTINTGNGGAAGEIIGEIWMNIDGENQIGPVDVQMTSSTASGQVSGQYTVGGFIGGAEAEGNADAILNISHNTANVAVNSNGSSAGGFVGFTLMQSSYPHNIQLNFTDDVAEGDVVGNFQVGGFLGSAIGMGPAIDLFDPNATGGLTISRSYASGNVSGTSDEVGGFAGGLAGYSVNPSVLQTITIDQCYARGSVLGGGVNTGGFVGVQYGATGISNAAALGNVSGNLNYTGGFVGDIGGADTSIRNSYAIGSVFGAPGGAVGGFAGLLESLGSISNSFSVGAVTADAGGGFIGSDTADESALSNDYFDIYNSLESSCLPSGGGATECTGVDNGGSDQSYFYLNSNAPFLNGSPVWDFTSIWEKHVAAYPTLRAVPFGLIGNSGLISGSANNPTIISSCTDLQNVSTGNYAGTYELGADIDCTGVDFQPIQFGPFGFQGVFNGQGHSISNLTINQDGQNVGLFSFLDGGIIENVSILSGSVTGTSYVGGLVGIAYDSIIQNVTSTIPVSGAGYAESIGGIVGATYFDDGQSYDWSHLIASSTVAGYNVTGGLAGTIDINYPGTAFHLDTATSTSVLTSTVDEINQSGGMIGILSADNIFGATSTVQITNSYSLITVSSTYGFLVGGFVGDVRANESGPYGEGPTEITISSSTAQGIMNSASYSYGWGGFVGAAETGGSSDSSITLSHDSATTNVNGVYSVGGFAGVGWVLNWNGPYHMEVNMTDDYATGAVSGIDFVGGFFGSTEGEGSFAYLSNELATGGLSIARSYSSGPVTGTGNEVGGFAGYVDCYSGNNAILHVCRFIQDFSTSPVVGTGYDIGGFVGNLAGFSSVEDSYETGDVSELSGKHVGGFVGQMGINSGNNSITRSYSTGSVTGSADINGGFVGQIAQDGAVIQNNFSAGAVNSGGGFIGGRSESVV